MNTKKLILLLSISVLFFLPACKKVEKEMLVTTGTVSNLLTTTADITGDILDLGEGATNYGHCYSTSPNPNISGTKTEYSSPSVGGFTSALTGLTPATKYYIKAFLRRGNDVVYGSEINFTTASEDMPELTTTIVTGITKTGAVSGGNITSQGGTAVTARGVCWSTATITALTVNKTTNGSGTGTFTSEISGLSAGTTYYVRAYATNGGGTKLGNELSFATTPDTPVPPTVTTAIVSSVTSNSAVCGGNVTSEGSSSVSERGVCWSTSTDPLFSGDRTIDSNGPGEFTSNLSGLEPGTKYYVRAYARSSSGTSYGNQVNFTTQALQPSLTTLPISSLTDVSARSGGYISSTGGAAILDKGVCWSTSSNPTVGDFVKSGGVGTPGTYEIDLNNLLPKTKYYTKAYASNSAGTSYGDEISFTTYSIPYAKSLNPSSISLTTATICGEVNAYNAPTTVTFEYGATTGYGQSATALQSPVSGSSLTAITATISGLIPSGQVYHFRIKAVNDFGTAYGDDIIFTTAVKDADNNIYQTVLIGSQVWMKENLKTTKYNDNLNIGRPASISIFLGASFGVFCYYNLDETNYRDTYGALYNWYAVSTLKLCPTGWRVPSYSSDFAALGTFLGSNSGGKIKEAGTSHWLTPNTGATNSSGFTALPAGQLSSDFYNLGEDAYFWTTDEFSGDVWFIGANYNSSDFNMYYFNKHNGLSVRCIKE
jgi:uncharacterized protein (TIGR02145 family)